MLKRQAGKFAAMWARIPNSAKAAVIIPVLMLPLFASAYGVSFFGGNKDHVKFMAAVESCASETQTGLKILDALDSGMLDNCLAAKGY